MVECFVRDGRTRYDEDFRMLKLEKIERMEIQATNLANGFLGLEVG
jgi:hypothetical protein